MKSTFREVLPSDAVLIGKWRTSPRVTQFLNTDIEFNLEQQISWIEKSYNRDDYYHWVIEVGGRPVGHIQITGIDLERKSAEWGYFIGEEDALGVGSHVPAQLYSFCFKELGLNELRVQCLHTNPRIIALHRMYGYHFAPQLDFVVAKGKEEFLSVGMTLQKADFMKSRFAAVSSDFPTALWKGNPF